MRESIIVTDVTYITVPRERWEIYHAPSIVGVSAYGHEQEDVAITTEIVNARTFSTVHRRRQSIGMTKAVADVLGLVMEAGQDVFEEVDSLRVRENSLLYKVRVLNKEILEVRERNMLLMHDIRTFNGFTAWERFKHFIRPSMYGAS